MQRFHQLSFVASLLALSWLGMMAVHELGHVVGALVTHGNVERVVLHPLTISRTDVSPNPNPTIVVWAGPVLGCLIPLIVWLSLPQHMSTTRNIAMFFAGFCLAANGAYIAIGSFDAVGDCGEMLRTGSPLWALLGFGALTIPLGLYLWHRLGSVKQFLDKPSLVDARLAYTMFAVLMVVVGCELVFSTY